MDGRTRVGAGAQGIKIMHVMILSLSVAYEMENTH